MIKMYFDYDERWLGKKMEILDMSGRVVLSKIINSKIEKIDVSHLNAGYSASAEEVLAILDRLHSEGTTIVVVTHSHEVARRTSRVLQVHDGLLVA